MRAIGHNSRPGSTLVEYVLKLNVADHSELKFPASCPSILVLNFEPWTHFPPRPRRPATLCFFLRAGV